MRFIARNAAGEELSNRTWYSVGGGFVVSDTVAADGQRQKAIAPDTTVLPLPFHSGQELLLRTHQIGGTIADVMRRNERHWRNDADIDSGLLHIWQVMQDCVKRGCSTDGVLPGGFKVKRRAAPLYRELMTGSDATLGTARPRLIGGPADPLQVLDWVNLYALAVNEENAAGGRVVTAPTNGAAGIVPAVLHYYARFVPGSTEKGVVDFLLTAAAIGLLYKENASISGAEVGCQGEVGVACSMAAGALCAVMGGTPEQVENAAEIGMEHHLGLTCDPVGGLVQIPCIERNAIASVKAINAARMALRGDGTHFVSLDQVIKTMRETGADMMSKYKETARGGLAVNIVEC
jgi:L-serine dehydratase